MRRFYCIVVFVALTPVSPPAAGPDYVDVAAARNVSFVGAYGPAFSGLAFMDQMMQTNMGNGAAVGDYDGDGDLDLYLLAQLGLQNRLLRNDLDLGSPGFTDVTAAAGVGDTGLSRVAHFVDLDNDGFRDLLLVNDDDGSGSYPRSKIYRNDGDGTFSDVSAASGFAPLGYLRCGVSIADYDRDGLPDVYVTNWASEIATGTAQYPGWNVLYRNLGDFRFEDVTAVAGLGTLARDSFTAIFHDFDGDGYPDLYVAIDHTSDEYYRNQNGVFVNATAAVGATHTGNDMGLDAADFDDDGDLDLYATNITNPSGFFETTRYNALHVNQDDGLGVTLFSEEAVVHGVGDTYWGWGVQFTDIENDGDLDIVAATGFDEFVAFVEGTGSAVHGTPTVVFLQGPGAVYTRVSVPALEAPDDSRALVAFDYDRDGDEDLLSTNVDQPVRLLENVSTPSGHWLEVALVQPGGTENRFGIGATVYATTGTVTRRRDVLAGDSYLAGTPQEVHFGLGDATLVDTLRVAWTDGSESVYSQVEVDRFVTAVQGVADADLDGIDDAADNCPARANPVQADADADGAGNPCDCAPLDATVWSAPPAAVALGFDDADPARLIWAPPANPGSQTPVYDVLRSTDRAFGAATCLASSTPATLASDPDPPSPIFYYLIRVTNPCGAHSGADSGATPRNPPPC